MTYLSQFRADQKHPTMADFVNDKDLRLAGRLDMDAEGLGFLTHHGGLQPICHRILPIKSLETYMVQVEGDVTEEKPV